MRNDWSRLDNKARFIMMVVDGKLIVNKKKKLEILKELKTLEFKPFPPERKRTEAITAVPDADKGTVCVCVCVFVSSISSHLTKCFRRGR